MSDSMPALKRKINSANDLRSVVRTMKAMAASSISQYEQSIQSLEEYQRTLRLGLIACLQGDSGANVISKAPLYQGYPKAASPPIGIIIFGSDQGLVGEFNDILLSFMKQKLGSKVSDILLWPVGELMQSRLSDEKLISLRSFSLPRSMDSITSLVTELLLEVEAQRERRNVEDIYLCFNQPATKAGFTPSVQKLLPLSNEWQQQLATSRWPRDALPQLIDGIEQTLTSLIHEYLFVSLFKACTASLASENASRLNAMQRAEKNIEELQDQLYQSYHSERQQRVDEELFDLVGGFEALQVENHSPSI